MKAKRMKASEEVMSESRTIMTNGWSTLNTVDDFDTGLTHNTKDILIMKEDISKTIAKSLFVESLVDQLCKLLEKDPTKRQEVYEGICSKLYEMHLVEDTFNIKELASLRSHFQQALLEVMVKPDSRVCPMSLTKLGSSRYATEFEEISFIASGGFGKVFKARNKLDQVVYAVKKISLKYQNAHTFAKKLNEVKTLARLNHPNIVQYKAAWLEPVLYFEPTIIPAEVQSLSSNDSDIVVFQSSHTNPSTSHKIEEEKEENNLAVSKYHSGGQIQRQAPKICAVLYVSMQLCDETLREWLNKRNLHNDPVDIPLVLNIMTKAAAGVEYIHSCNIVHHDIKPRNIFLSSDLKSVQVGDFGLSCCLQGHDHSDCPLEGGQFGTPLYAAPEQLKGRCDPKSDMFSLGLIFIELLTVFSTEMERGKILTEARSGRLPPSIPPGLTPIIKELLSHKSRTRPSASSLLLKLQELNLNDLYETERAETLPHSYVEEKEQLLIDKDREIDQLRQMLAQKENEIAELKQQQFLLKKTGS